MSNATVLFDYDAEADDELTLKEGELIANVDKKEDGWWEGELNGRRGMFPENFVKEIKRSAPESSEQKVSNAKTAVAKVTFDYDAENDDELSLKEGEIVEVLAQEEEGWWKGTLNGKVGVFPTNFVELEKGSIPVPVSQPAANEEPNVEKGSEKRAKALGGVGFGGLLTQDALSGIKLRKSNSNTKINPSQKTEKTAEPLDLHKKLSMKRNRPIRVDLDKPIGPSESKRKALVEFDYEKEQTDELTLSKGDIVNILESDVSEGWSKGEVNGTVGLFPDNFVKFLPPEQPKKEIDISKEMDAPKIPEKNEDAVDAKPGRPELPFVKLKKPSVERPSTQLQNESTQPELPVNLKPVPNSKLEEILKKTEHHPVFESKPVTDEKPAKLQDKHGHKKSPPLLPKKPDKPKPPVDNPDATKVRSTSPLALKKPPIVLRNQNGLDKDTTKRFSSVTPSELNPDLKIKRHSQGSEPMNLNDIKSTGILLPLTTDRPKNTAKSPPTKYGKPHSPKRISTPEKSTVDEAEWLKEAKEMKKPLEKPRKPALPENSKPKTESMADSNIVKKLQDQINGLKDSLESVTKKLTEHIEKSERKFEKMEKKLVGDIEDITKELDEEKKARSGVDVEVKRLTKLIKNQQVS